MEVTESHHLFANIGKIIAAGQSIDDSIGRIMEEIRIFFQPTHCSLLRVDQEAQELYFASIVGIDMEKVKEIRLKLNEGIAGTVAVTGNSYFVPDTSKEPHFSRKVDEITGFVTKSIIAVPLVYQDTCYGVIEIVNRQTGELYTEKDHLILHTIADFSAISLYVSSMFEQLRIQANLDSLTGVYNRSRLRSELDKQSDYKKHGRREHDLSVATAIVLDLDKFKNINDSYGHRSGDLVLIDFTSHLKKIVRENDLIFRTGGDEFLIVLYNYNEKEADLAAERITSELKKLRLSTAQYQFPYGFSFGLSHGLPTQLENIIYQADIKMYEKK